MGEKEVIVSKFNIINIFDLVDSVGETEVIDSISKFKCNKNSEIEEFIYKDAIDFARRKISVTHLIYDNEAKMFGKDSFCGDRLNGNDMMNMSLSILSKVQREVGGGIVFFGMRR